MFTAATYEGRRRALARRLSTGVVLLPAAAEAAMRYRDNPHPFVQDGSFAYFVGLDEPDLVALIDCDTGATTLYGQEDGIDDILWHGPRPSLAARAERAGIHLVEPVARLAEALDGARAAGRPIRYPPPYRASTTLALAAWLDVAPAAVASGASQPLVDAIVALREVKDGGELAEMETALAVTAEMHKAAMRASVPGAPEAAVVGEMAAVVARAGRRFAYPPIFSRRGEVLHNMRHDGRLERGDLVINDSGATSPMGYASDITRTLPVGGRFSARQRELYDLVLDAQSAAIAAMRPGVPYRDVHQLAARVIAEGMVALGLMRGDPDELVADGVPALVFPSGLGHPIGLDTHDMEALGEARVGYGDDYQRSPQFGLNHLRLAKPLRTGMVVTVEPGIYFIEPLIERWAAEARHGDRVDWAAMRAHVGLGGIRIEDMVLVTTDGARVLGTGIPKAAGEVEALMG